MSDILDKAREFQEKYLPHMSPAEQPVFHVTGGIGWINDPNGFSCYKGEYHLFYQYHPYSTKWGPMHWGHVKSHDFIKWERLPVALAPDTEADCDGCFSGSAVELEDGRHALIYTGVRRERSEEGFIREYQHQCVAFGDGVNYEKYEGNPVISGAQVPEGNSILDFRDPKVWKEGDRFYMVVGNRTSDSTGEILLYSSADLLTWDYETVLEAGRGVYGRMWECPDFFHLDHKDIVLTSPQEMTPVGLEFHAGYGTMAIVGEFDRKTKVYTRENVQAVDYGIDFYAPTTLQTPDGRRIMIAWMQNWETCNCQPQNCRWYGAMTIPRELRVIDGRLVQTPVRELANYRTNPYIYSNILVFRETNLIGVKGRVLDMTVTVKPMSDNNRYKAFRINIAKDGEHVAVLRYKPDAGILRIDRTRCGGRYDIVHTREIPVTYYDGMITIRLIMDRNYVEMFINDGEQAATFQLYAPITADSISFESEGSAAIIDVEKYDLKIEG